MSALERKIAVLEKANSLRVVIDDSLPALPQQAEKAEVVEGMAQAQKALLESLVKCMGLTPEEALAKVMSPSPGAVGDIGRLPLDWVSFNDLGTLCRQDPAAGLAKWQQIRAAARKELQSGNRAAGAVQIRTQSSWRLAQFLAVREELASDGKSLNGNELLLVDRAAQVYTLLEFWQEELNDRMALVTLGSRGDRGKDWSREEDVRNMELAMNMVERLQTMLERILKLVQTMRRDHIRSRRSQ